MTRQKHALGDEGWTKVNHRKYSGFRSRWDTECKLIRKEDKVSTSIFFTEYPEHLGAKYFYKLFEEFSEIDEVVIPPNRDKRGKKYDFVHFLEVRDERSLVLKLDNLMIEGRKLFANIPRFQRAVEGVFSSDKVKAMSYRGGESFSKNQVKLPIYNLSTSLFC